MNLVGVLPGSRWGSADDRVLIVGSSWHLGPPATRDLGSGLAALLEVARVVMADNKFSPDYSVIFVAFDKERDERQGSKAFIDEYLMPHVISRFNCTSQVKKKEEIVRCQLAVLFCRVSSTWRQYSVSLTKS